jgi:repressor LexA
MAQERGIRARIFVCTSFHSTDTALFKFVWRGAATAWLDWRGGDFERCSGLTLTAEDTTYISSMNELTRAQQRILDFIQGELRADRPAPTHQEIAERFGFRSTRAAACHLEALKRKGVIESEPGKVRSLRVVSPLQSFRKRIADIPIFGSIPAGFADKREQEAKGCVSIDIGTLGIKPSPRTFALEVRGDSMIGRHIVDGDVVVVEHGQTPRNGDVVAALIDGESTLKTFVANNGKPHLKAENPKYPKLIPASELVIQGVMVALIRKRK